MFDTVYGVFFSIKKAFQNETFGALISYQYARLRQRWLQNCLLAFSPTSPNIVGSRVVFDATHAYNEQVAFWSAALDPNRDESSLSARLSALSGLRSGLTLDARREFLAKCVGLVAGARTTRGRRINHPGELPEHLVDPMLLVAFY